MELQGSAPHANGRAPAKDPVVDAHTTVQPSAAKLHPPLPKAGIYNSGPVLPQQIAQQQTVAGPHTQWPHMLQQQQQHPSKPAPTATAGNGYVGQATPTAPDTNSADQPGSREPLHTASNALSAPAADGLTSSRPLAEADGDKQARDSDAWEGSEHAHDSEWEVDDGTRFSDEDGEPGGSELSDDSLHPGRSRKRKRRTDRGPSKRPTPPMNETRGKLRSAAPAEASPNPAAQDDITEAAPVFERVVTHEEEQVQLAALRSDYHMATILEFFATFRYAAGLAACEFEAEALESALVTSYGEGPGLLADIHMVLLKGISPRSDVHSRNWTVVLADRLKRGCWGTGHMPPFAPQRYHEAEGYAALPTPDRVLALNLLCDLRLDREDLRLGIEESLKPPPKPPKAPKTAPPPLPKEQPTRSSTRSNRYAPPPVPPVIERPAPPLQPQKGEIVRLPMRKEPLGTDASGSTYWLIETSRPLGTRLYKELSLGHASAKKAAPRGRGADAQFPPAPLFDLVGCTSEELQAVGERLARSKRKPDQRVAAQILDGVVPAMAAAAAEELRQAKAAERLRNQLGVIMDSDGGYGRPKRSRKEVNYSYDAYDDMIRKAIRGRRGEEQELHRRNHHAQPMAPEPSRPGLRRGRSAANADPQEASASPAPPTRPSSPLLDNEAAIQSDEDRRPQQPDHAEDQDDDAGQYDDDQDGGLRERDQQSEEDDGGDWQGGLVGWGARSHRGTTYRQGRASSSSPQMQQSLPPAHAQQYSTLHAYGGSAAHHPHSLGHQPPAQQYSARPHPAHQYSTYQPAAQSYSAHAQAVYPQAQRYSGYGAAAQGYAMPGYAPGYAAQSNHSSWPQLYAGNAAWQHAYANGSAHRDDASNGGDVEISE